MAGRPSAIAAAAAALVAFACPAAQAQVYELDGTPAPPNKSLHVLQLFYVLPGSEAPGAGAGASEPATVRFRDLEAHSALPMVKDADMMSYSGMQVTMMPFPPDLSDVLNPLRFCSTAADVVARGAAHADQLLVLPGGQNRTHSRTVRFGLAAATDAARVRQSGVYMLVLSNCGDFQGATVSGTISLKGAHGFLPGNEYYKMPLFGWLAIAYACTGVAWALAMLARRQELAVLHYALLAAALVGFVEAMVWWLLLSKWNIAGAKDHVLSTAAMALSVAKVSASYMFALGLSSGWGVTLQALDQGTNTKMEVLTVAYVVACYARETVLSFRHSHNLRPLYLFGSLVPAALLNAAIFAWILSALRGLVETLSERHQDDAAGLLKASRAVLVSALAVAYPTFALQLLEVLEVLHVPWRYHWVLNDAVYHIVFLLATGALMLLWKPDTELQMYAYSGQVPQDENVEVGKGNFARDLGVLPDDPDDGLDDLGPVRVSRGAPRRSAGVAPDIIGVGGGTNRKALE